MNYSGTLTKQNKHMKHLQYIVNWEIYACVDVYSLKEISAVQYTNHFKWPILVGLYMS